MLISLQPTEICERRSDEAVTRLWPDKDDVKLKRKGILILANWLPIARYPGPRATIIEKTNNSPKFQKDFRNLRKTSVTNTCEG